MRNTKKRIDLVIVHSGSTGVLISMTPDPALGCRQETAISNTLSSKANGSVPCAMFRSPTHISLS